MNPFLIVQQNLQLKSDAQGPGLRFSYLYCLLAMGSALHTASPTQWHASSMTAGDEVLRRLASLGLADTFAVRELRTFFVEAKLV